MPARKQALTLDVIGWSPERSEVGRIAGPPFRGEFSRYIGGRGEVGREIVPTSINRISMGNRDFRFMAIFRRHRRPKAIESIDSDSLKRPPRSANHGRARKASLFTRMRWTSNAPSGDTSSLPLIAIDILPVPTLYEGLIL